MTPAIYEALSAGQLPGQTAFLRSGDRGTGSVNDTRRSASNQGEVIAGERGNGLQQNAFRRFQAVELWVELKPGS